MKTLRITFLMIFGLFLAQYSFGQISGTSHDFSGQAWNPGGEICVVCHTPHNALTNETLWNHASTAATFQVYTSSSMDAATGQPSASSKLCLSCHDGTVALDSFGGATGSSLITGNALLGTDLRNDHPISFTYDATLATTDGELFDPTSGLSGLGGTIDADMLLGGQMECASCHDVHGTGIANLLVKSNASSALCLTCHNK